MEFCKSDLCCPCILSSREAHSLDSLSGVVYLPPPAVSEIPLLSLVPRSLSSNETQQTSILCVPRICDTLACSLQGIYLSHHLHRPADSWVVTQVHTVQQRLWA